MNMNTILIALIIFASSTASGSTSDVSLTTPGSINNGSINTTKSTNDVFPTTPESTNDVAITTPGSTTNDSSTTPGSTTDDSSTTLTSSLDNLSTALSSTANNSPTTLEYSTDHSLTSLASTTNDSSTTPGSTTDDSSTSSAPSLDNLSTTPSYTADNSSTTLEYTTYNSLTSLASTTDNSSAAPASITDESATTLASTTDNSSAAPASITGESATTLASTTDNSSATPASITGESATTLASTTDNSSAAPASITGESATTLASTHDDSSTTSGSDTYYASTSKASTTDASSTTLASTTGVSSTTPAFNIGLSSASPVSTSKGPSTSTTHSPDNNLIPVGKDNLTVKVEASVSVNLEFTDELNKPSSTVYLNLSSEFEKKLTDVYNSTNIKGFAGIIINGFSKGSVICEYSVLFKAAINLTEVASTIKEKTITVYGQPASMETSAQSLTRAMSTGLTCKTIVNPCVEKNMECEENKNGDGILCINRCNTDLSCGVNKECYLDIVTAKFGCRCKATDDVIYSGPTCTRKVEILPLSSTKIITIAAVSGGVSMAILTTAIVCLCVRNRKLNSKLKSSTDGSTCEEDQVQMRSLGPEIPTDRQSNEYVAEPVLHRGDHFSQDVNNVFYYSGQRQSSKYGRDGSKDVNYNSPRDQHFLREHPSPRAQSFPRNHSSSLDKPSLGDLRHPGRPTTDYEALRKSSSNLYSHSFYDSIDTTIKFEIRRPSVRTNKAY